MWPRRANDERPYRLRQDDINIQYRYLPQRGYHAEKSPVHITGVNRGPIKLLAYTSYIIQCTYL